MEEPALKSKIISKVEVFTVTAMQAFLITVVLVAVFVLYWIFVRNLIGQARHLQTVEELLPAMQRSFAGVLTVVLGLELLETLKTYFTEQHVRLEVILVVAIIAVGRHVIQVDFEHTPGPVLVGLSTIIIALAVGYFLVKKAQLAAGRK